LFGQLPAARLVADDVVNYRTAPWVRPKEAETYFGKMTQAALEFARQFLNLFPEA
jgi:hypothetical protein